MFKTLRNRLILSHILPLLIILPLMGIGLIYALETQIYLPALSGELENDAQFMAQLTSLDESIWHRFDKAQAIVDLYSTQKSARIMLLDPNGTLLASSETADQERLGQNLDNVDLSTVRKSGSVSHQIHYSTRQNAEIIDVIMPVKKENDELLGFIRLSYTFATLTDEVYQLRFIIFALLALGLLIGSGVGYILAVSLSQPVRETTQAISALANSSQVKLLPVYGPEEIQLLSRSVNGLVNRLRELEKARQQLLSNLVHEIGRPLGALRSAITALSSGAEKDPELYQDLLTGMDQETEQLQRLLEDLYGLHDQILGILELEIQPINFQAWLPDILQTWKAAAQEKGIQWEFAIDQNLSIVKADPTRLAQILGNLASNAIKFTPPGGTISILASGGSGRVRIDVRDSGPGMSAEEQQKIFQPFFRGSSSRRFPKGMGLGLSIARDLTEAHGGKLSVESSPGKGSQFTIWLPGPEL